MSLYTWVPPELSSQQIVRATEVAIAYLAQPNATSPVLFMDREVLRSQATRWRRRLPTVTPYYAVKANIDPVVLHELFDQGMLADVASTFEIRICESLGVPGDRMVLSNPRKDAMTIQTMVEVRVFGTAVDSEEEVDKLVAAGIPSSDYEPVLFVRLKVPTKGVTQDLSSKFGVRVLPPGTDPFARPFPGPQLDAVRGILRRAWSAGFRKIGLSTHVGTQCVNAGVYIAALELLQAVAEQLTMDGINVGWIDLGGGFADGRTLAAAGTDADTLLGRIAAAVRRWSGPPVQFLAEPGRYMVADAGTLLTQVIYDRNTDATGRRVQIDDGVYRTLSGRIHDEKSYQFSAMRSGDTPFAAAVAQMVVWGCSCDSFDMVTDNATLPADLGVGDFLLADTLGAYSTSFGSNTNGFQPAPIVLFWDEDGTYRFETSPLAAQNQVLLSHIRSWRKQSPVGECHE